MSTYVLYKERMYECFDFNDRTTTSINSVRINIAAALEISELSSQDIVEIGIDDNQYVVLNDYYLAKKNPWKSCADTELLFSAAKKIILRIVSNSDSQSHIQPVLVSATQSGYAPGNSDFTTASTTSQSQQLFSVIPKDMESTDIFHDITTNSDADHNLQFFPNYGGLSGIDQLRFNAQVLSEQLKFIYNVAPRQRLQYPRENNLVLIQRHKEDEDRKKSMQPVLQIPSDHVRLIDAGGPIDLISAVVHKVNSHVEQSYYCLAPYRGFWPIDKNNRPPRDSPFFNPFISPILPEQLQKVQTGAGDFSFQIELPLCLMYAVGRKYDLSPPPLVRFDHCFPLSQAAPVPSYYDVKYSLYRAATTTNSQETVNQMECYLWCALRSDPKGDFPDFNTDCVSDMFTVEPRVSSTNVRIKTNTR